MRLLSALAMLLAMTSLASADEPIRVPSEVKGGTNQFIVIKGETTGKVLRWRSFDPALQVIDSSLLTDAKTTIVISSKAGRYTLWVWGAVDGLPTDLYPIAVVVGDPAPNPLPPAPVPPSPVPPAPVPDPLKNKLRALYDADNSPTKRQHLVALHALYEVASKITNKPTLKTVSDLRSDLAVAAESVTPGALLTVRELLRDELASTLGTDPLIVLDDDRRKKALELFLRIAAILLQILGETK